MVSGRVCTISETFSQKEPPKSVAYFRQIPRTPGSRGFGIRRQFRPCHVFFPRRQTDFTTYEKQRLLHEVLSNDIVQILKDTSLKDVVFSLANS